MLLLFPLVIPAQAREPVRHGGHAHQIVTAAGMVTTTVGRTIHCPAVGHDFVLVATPRGVALTTRF